MTRPQPSRRIAWLGPSPPASPRARARGSRPPRRCRCPRRSGPQGSCRRTRAAPAAHSVRPLRPVPIEQRHPVGPAEVQGGHHAFLGCHRLIRKEGVTPKDAFASTRAGRASRPSMPSPLHPPLPRRLRRKRRRTGRGGSGGGSPFAQSRPDSPLPAPNPTRRDLRPHQRDPHAAVNSCSLLPLCAPPWPAQAPTCWQPRVSLKTGEDTPAQVGPGHGGPRRRHRHLDRPTTRTPASIARGSSCPSAGDYWMARPAWPPAPRSPSTRTGSPAQTWYEGLPPAAVYFEAADGAFLRGLETGDGAQRRNGGPLATCSPPAPAPTGSRCSCDSRAQRALLLVRHRLEDADDWSGPAGRWSLRCWPRGRHARLRVDARVRRREAGLQPRGGRELAPGHRRGGQTVDAQEPYREIGVRTQCDGRSLTASTPRSAQHPPARLKAHDLRPRR